ncbi:MAG: hypothetical protein QGI83_14220 [Candidatus Latescibacteria bacterium]|nr:hypothetical protein [Candidatus Latescibacterota bacterium]
MIAQRDRNILRELGKRKAEIAALPVQDERRRAWSKLNDLYSERPMVWIFEIPWHEMNVDDELTLRCEDEPARTLELALRRELYQWDHMPGDMVIGPAIEVGPSVRDTGFGLSEQVDIAQTDPASSVVSRSYHIQIRNEGDIDKIQTPEVTLDAEMWDRRYELLSEIFDGVLPVERAGFKSTSIAPWDLLVRLTGVDELLIDMHERPAYVHKSIDRLTRAHIRRLEKYEDLNILAPNNDRWLGGGYQFTDGLPGASMNPDRIVPSDMWGRTMSQIFSAVSPAMHEEFALQYECRYLSRFGLTYYGCCEPLDKKVDILRNNVPNLRKISMSPWIDLDLAAENVDTDFVFSFKPNPAVLAVDQWDPAFVRKDMAATLERLEGLHVELVMKDISTVRYEPQRLWEWARIASELCAV